MSDKPRILVTGFGAFPGAPYNPTMPLVERLMRLRRPAFDDVELSSHIFHVTYATVDRELPGLLRKHRPHALLMFGLAARTPYLRIETRARNAITTIWPDADGTRIRKGSIAPGVGCPDVRPAYRKTAARGAGERHRRARSRAMPAAISATI